MAIGKRLNSFVQFLFPQNTLTPTDQVFENTLIKLLHPNPFPPEYHNPSRHENVSHMEHVFVSRYIHTRTPPMCPKWARWWCSAGSPPLPFLQADTKMCPTWGTFSCLLPTFPPHLSPFPLNTKKCPLR